MSFHSCEQAKLLLPVEVGNVESLVVHNCSHKLLSSVYTSKILVKVIIPGIFQGLKSYDLIDVKQEVPYGDISLKLTQTLSKAHI